MAALIATLAAVAFTLGRWQTWAHGRISEAAYQVGRIAQSAFAGVKVTERVAHWSPPNEHNAEYLEVKREKMGHLPEVLDLVRMRAWQKR